MPPEPLSKTRMCPLGSTLAECWAQGPLGCGSSGKVKLLCRPPSRHTMSPTWKPSWALRAIFSTALRCRNDASRSPSGMTATESMCA